LKEIMRRASLAVSVLIAACAATPDHFYTLAVLPEGAPTGLSAPTLHVLLSVRVPELVDRPELVVSTSSTGILVLEHERWGISLSDQMVQTLARDIEKRRSDVLVADRAFDQGTRPPIRITVDIVRLTARRGDRVSMEARWRIVDESAGIDAIGGDEFDRPVDAAGYDAIARAFSQALAALADRLAADVRRH